MTKTLRALAAVPFLAAAVTAAAQPRGPLTIIPMDYPPPQAARSSDTTAINSFGHVTGAISPFFPASNPYLYTPATGVVVQPIPGDASIRALSDAGHMAGWYFPSGASTPLASILHNGELTTFQNLPGAAGGAIYGVNNAGVAVGTAIANNRNIAAVVFQNGAPTPLPSLGVAGGVAYDINNAGQIVGSSRTPQDLGRACLWQNGQAIDLGTLGGSTSEAVAINDLGMIVGSSAVNPSRDEGFIWHDGVMTSAGTLGGTRSGLLGINNLGQAVGFSLNAAGQSRAVIWDGELVDLNTLLPPGSGWERLEVATGINDQGFIIGNGIYNGRQRGFLIIPSPAGALLMLGFGIIAPRRRRR